MSEKSKKDFLVQIVLEMRMIEAENTEGDYSLCLNYACGLDIMENYSPATIREFFNKVWNFYFSTCTDGYVVTVRENDEH